jgi:hypothetical protein
MKIINLTSQNNPSHHSERNVERIGKPRQKSRSAPAAYRATGKFGQYISLEIFNFMKKRLI